MDKTLLKQCKEYKPKLLGDFIFPLSEGLRYIKKMSIHTWEDIEKMEQLFITG